MDQIIQRSDIKEPIYQEIFSKESHHDHEIIMDEYGILRWKQDDFVAQMKEDIGVNDIVDLLASLGCNYNSEIFRKFYRSIGYSIEGYWEIFYWDVNNPKASEYKQKAAKLP